MSSVSPAEATDFIRAIINEDIAANKHGGKVVTRFPPEPNGYLHIGHAKSICLNFGIATEYRGVCHLRFDDTDPIKEDVKFEESIKDTVRWLGFSWGDHLYHASDYFDQLYELAVALIKSGKAYVCSQTLEETRAYRGTVTEAGRNSPFRERTIEENLDLFARMKGGEFKDGEHTLRAKIDMASPNMKMRDPLLYRIRHATHHRTGDSWCIYPLYDFAHCLSDAIEGITHSLCTLEFENNRELYNWIINALDMPSKPQQYEFARLNINYTVLSKRKILELVDGGYVTGWDDPRLLTLVGLRRRGYTPESIRYFCASVGMAKANSVVDMAQLEHSIRNDLNSKAPRVLAVLHPLKLTITNYPKDKRERLTAPFYPEDVPKEGDRELPFSRELYIERDDFMENPSKGYYRLSPGAEVRLRYAYLIKCEEVIRDANGEVSELLCTYDETTPVGENPSDGRRVKGTIHWLSRDEALPVEVRAYDRLFTVEDPGARSDYLETVNTNSLIFYPDALIEPSVKGSPKETHFQFERHGFFVTDLVDSTGDKLVFNRTVTLKDSWAKQSAPATQPKPKPKKPLPVQKTEKELSDGEEAIALRYEGELGLGRDYAVILAQDTALAHYFNEAVTVYRQPKEVANWVINEVQRQLKNGKALVTPQHLAELVKAVDEEVISSKMAKELFGEMSKSGDSPLAIIEAKGLQQISDPKQLLPLIDRVLQDNQEVVDQIRAGRTNRMGFLTGQVMKATGGKANPKLLQSLLAERLGL